MSAVSIWRNDHNGRTLLRTQPAAGFDSRTVTDYECPYEENVTYNWTATYSDPGDGPQTYDEQWASFTGWSGDTGDGGVSSGVVTLGPAGFPVSIYRAAAFEWLRISIESLETVSGDNAQQMAILVLDSATEIVLQVIAGVLWVGVGSTYKSAGLDPSLPFSITQLGTSIAVTGSGGDGVQLPMTYSPMASLYLSAGAGGTVSLGGVTANTAAPTFDIAETSDPPVSLNPADAWLIHPGTVGLSIPLAETDATAAGIIDIAAVENPSNATVHKILGSATPIPTTTGPRTDDRTTMTLATVTTEESVSLRALLAPDVPLLVQIPPSWDLDFNSGFYAIGDTSTGRTGEPRSPRRIVTLPMQKVQSPVVDVENTGWSYADIAVEFDTYGALLTTFATYADLASNTRS
jgi:hypothetical protein